MTKATCRYCKCEASPKNLLRILTLPGMSTVIDACDLCFATEYQLEREGKQAVLMAEIMLAEAVGDEERVNALTPKNVASRLALGLI